jgi:DNA polymerase III subunit delta'
MTWQGIEGHDDVVAYFRRVLARNRLASTYLFVGPAGVGKRLFAERLAQALLCQRATAESLEPCGKCTACVQVLSHTHPDLYIVEKPPDKSAIPISSFVGDDNRRMREGLCHDIALKPFMGGRKIAIIDDADTLNEESANCLLKTLEEPPPHSLLILIGTSPDKQLPTIRSRAQVVRFRPLDRDTVASVLVSRGMITDPEQARRLAAFSAGSTQRALKLADDELWAFRERLLAYLAKGQLESGALAGELVALVEAAGKEASSRRERARETIGFAIEFYHQLLRALCEVEPQGDDALKAAVNQAASHWPGDAELAARLLDRSIDALAQIDRNAHLTTLVECWLDDLAREIDSSQGPVGASSRP